MVAVAPVLERPEEDGVEALCAQPSEFGVHFLPGFAGQNVYLCRYQRFNFFPLL